MKRLRIYVDTSVIGDCFDPEFRAWGKGNGVKSLFLTKLVEGELLLEVKSKIKI
jgi:hypothetical protein